MQALHDVVKAGYTRYIGMSSCYAWQCQFFMLPVSAQYSDRCMCSPSNAEWIHSKTSNHATTDYMWTRLCNQQPPHAFHFDAEPLQSCVPWRRARNDANLEGARAFYLRGALFFSWYFLLEWQHFGVGSIPWSPLARGLLTRPLGVVTTTRGGVDKWACHIHLNDPVLDCSIRWVGNYAKFDSDKDIVNRSVGGFREHWHYQTFINVAMQFGRNCQEERCEHGPDRARVVHAKGWWVIPFAISGISNAHHEMQVLLPRSLAPPHSTTWRTSLVCAFSIFWSSAVTNMFVFSRRSTDQLDRGGNELLGRALPSEGYLWALVEPYYL